MSDPHLMQSHTVRAADVYVPAARRKTLDTAKAEEIAESMIDEGQLTPIQVRVDGERYVLVEGLHRLEACKLLEKESILALFVQAKRR
tara:strand:- start:1088 stop:1351 length:264 start_codon:yes stop_codon:yes gene_type:complete